MKQVKKQKQGRSLKATAWFKNDSGIMFKRTALALAHPESWVSLWKKKYGDLDGFPWVEVYGDYPDRLTFIRNSIEECPTCGRKF